MIARQKRQAELLQELTTADRESARRTIKEQEELIDDTFFAMLRASMDVAERSGEEDQALKLVNLQARLFRDTRHGRRLERQQQAIRRLGREANQAGGLTPRLLLQHILANRDDDLVVDSLVSAGQQALNYEFFLLLSEHMDKRQKSGKNVDDLAALRDRLLAVQQELEHRSRELFEAARSVLDDILKAEDRRDAVRRNIGRIDNTFMFLLSQFREQAASSGDERTAEILQQVEDLILAEVEEQAPAEVRLLNELVRAEDEQNVRRILADRPDMVTPQLLEVVRLLNEQEGGAGRAELGGRLDLIESILEAQLATQGAG
jgi:hypothetical protein